MPGVPDYEAWWLIAEQRTRDEQARCDNLTDENKRLRECIMRALGVLIEEHNRDKAERILSAALVGGNG